MSTFLKIILDCSRPANGITIFFDFIKMSTFQKKSKNRLIYAFMNNIFFLAAIFRKNSVRKFELKCFGSL